MFMMRDVGKGPMGGGYDLMDPATGETIIMSRWSGDLDCYGQVTYDSIYEEFVAVDELRQDLQAYSRLFTQPGDVRNRLGKSPGAALNNATMMRRCPIGALALTFLRYGYTAVAAHRGPGWNIEANVIATELIVNLGAACYLLGMRGKESIDFVRHAGQGGWPFYAALARVAAIGPPPNFPHRSNSALLGTGRFFRHVASWLARHDPPSKELLSLARHRLWLQSKPGRDPARVAAIAVALAAGSVEVTYLVKELHDVFAFLYMKIFYTGRSASASSGPFGRGWELAFWAVDRAFAPGVIDVEDAGVAFKLHVLPPHYPHAANSLRIYRFLSDRARAFGRPHCEALLMKLHEHLLSMRTLENADYETLNTSFLTVVDVGAHHGDCCLWIAAHARHIRSMVPVRCLSVEAEPALAKAAMASVAANGFRDSVEIEVVRVGRDWIPPAAYAKRIDLVKVNTGGSELEVFAAFLPLLAARAVSAILVRLQPSFAEAITMMLTEHRLIGRGGYRFRCPSPHRGLVMLDHLADPFRDGVVSVSCIVASA